MKLFSMNTELHNYDTLAAFTSSFNLTEQDLILTSTGMFDRKLKGLGLPCRLLFHDKYGKGEPTSRKIDALIKEAHAESFERLIAIGGGTVLDISKILILKDLDCALDAFERKVPLIKSHPLICIPTTCGTGSEVTNISIIEVEEKSTKLGLADPVLIPDHAVLIPELITDLPYASYLYSSADALIHALESYVSPKANTLTKTLSLEAITIILEVYQLLAQKGPALRHAHHKDMLLASTMAGVAFGNAGVGAVHALSYPLGGSYHVPHGEANTHFFMAVFSQYQKKKPDGTLAALREALADILAVDQTRVWQSLAHLMDQLIKRCPLRDFGMKEAEIETWADSVIASQQRLLQNNYVALSRDEIRDIYSSLY